jgi:N-methylhydantoinase A/oxoprolinase/acetone carboxylase beta subunit
VDRHLRELEARRLVLRSAFTPTDALHVLGRFSRWNTTAARLGAELLGAQVGLTPETFSERVAVRISEQLATALVGKVLEDEAGVASWEKAPVGVALLERALQQTDSNLGCRLSLKRHIVAVGAPAAAYLPEAAAHLGTEIVVPDHAEVANAVGAVVGGVVQRYEVSIRPAPGGEAFLLQLPSGVRSVVSIEEAVEIATGEVPDIVRARAREAGADHVEVRVARQDHSAPIRAGGGQRVFVETVIIFTAVGRPAVA